MPTIYLLLISVLTIVFCCDVAVAMSSVLFVCCVSHYYYCVLCSYDLMLVDLESVSQHIVYVG